MMAEPFRRATGLNFAGGAAAVLLGLASVPVALAQSAEDLTVDLAECVDLAAAEERFACYEARVNAVIEERDGAAEEAASAATGDDVAGRQISAPAGPESVDAAATSSQEVASESGEIVGTIAALRETAPDTYLITLDNGQIWRQVASKRYRLQTGMDVRIYPGWGNSLRLTAVGANGFIQVERIDAGAEQVASADRANSGAADADSTRSNDQAAGADESIGTIVALRETTPDKYVITLDNGQVWRQVATKRYRLQTGMDVRIYPGWGNSLRLTAVDANGFIQVERAR